MELKGDKDGAGLSVLVMTALHKNSMIRISPVEIMQTALRNTLNAFHLACLVYWIQSNSSEENKCRTQGHKAPGPFTELSPKIAEKTCASWKEQWERLLGAFTCFLSPCAPEWMHIRISSTQADFRYLHLKSPYWTLKILAFSQHPCLGSQDNFLRNLISQEQLSPAWLLQGTALSTEMLLGAQQSTALISAVHNPA